MIRELKRVRTGCEVTVIRKEQNNFHESGEKMFEDELNLIRSVIFGKLNLKTAGRPRVCGLILVSVEKLHHFLELN